MMASYRSSEPQPLEQPLPNEPMAPAPKPGEPTTLPPSGVVAGIDWVLCLIVLALAFLLASFAVRNSDFFLHLAAGRLLSDGGYTLGKDPFSYVGGDRTWVNHAWLFDLLLYKLYAAGGGPATVIAKAIAIALAAGLLLLARRPGQSVFPSVVCVGLALIAAAPRMFLQPSIASLLAIAALMLLLVKMPRPKNSWRFPISVAILFALWSNLDQWFFLGPAALFLYIVGQIIRPEEGEDPSVMWKALLLGTLACMINPHHYRVWTLPPELADGALAKIMADDIEFGPLFRSALTKGSLDFTGERSNPTNLYCTLALLVFTLVGLVVNIRKASLGLAMIWVGSVVLALLHLRAIPFLAFVSAPIAAINLAAGLTRLVEKPRPEQTIRIFLAVRAVGRNLVLLLGLLLVALSYPGWLHPSTTPPRRWDWEIDPNPSMKRMAEQLQDWHRAGFLPTDARMLNLQPDFAHYVAWYAPDVKTFFDSRLKFHREEAANYAAVRKYLAPRSPRDTRTDSFDFTGFLRTQDVTYVVTCHPSPKWNEAVVARLLSEQRDPSRGPEWAMWHIEGRAVALGWTRQGKLTRTAFDRLRFDPLRAAYTQVRIVDDGKSDIPLPPQNDWDRFITSPPVAPPEAEETLQLLSLRETLINKTMMEQSLNWYAFHLFGRSFMTPALNLWTELPGRPNSPIPTLLPPEVNAASVLAVRAARRAILSSPDHPDGYYFLARAYPSFVGYEFTQDIEQFVTTAALARCRVRVPNDPAQRRAYPYALDLFERLRDAHKSAGPARLDLWLEQSQSISSFFRAETEELEANLDTFEGDERKQKQEELDLRNRRLKEIDREVEQLEATIRKNTQDYVNTAAGLTSALDRASVARRYGLAREAISELYKAHETIQKQLEEEGERKRFTTAELAYQYAVHADLIELMIYDGRIEEAVQILDTIENADTVSSMESDGVRAEYFNIRRKALGWLSPRNPQPTPFDREPALRYRGLRQAASLALGDYTRASQVQAKQLQLSRKDLEAFRAEHFPKELPDFENVPSQRELQLELFYRPQLTPMILSRGFYAQKVETLLGLQRDLVEQQTRVGLTHLEQGDMKAAEGYFKQAAELPEWKMTFPAQRTAQEFLKAFDRARAMQGTAP